MIKHLNPAPEYKNLEPFIGKWNTIGHIKGNAHTKPVEVKGTDTYEWLPGGFFLLHKVDVLVGNERNESLEIIGFDASNNAYPMRHFDNKGNTGLMHAKLQHDTWTFLSATLRFTGAFSENGKILSGIWEQSEDGATWTPWMEIRLTKYT